MCSWITARILEDRPHRCDFVIGIDKRCRSVAIPISQLTSTPLSAVLAALSTFRVRCALHMLPRPVNAGPQPSGLPCLGMGPDQLWLSGPSALGKPSVWHRFSAAG